MRIWRIAARTCGKIGPPVPIFLASGNHEDEEGWNLDDTPFSIGLASIQARKAYFPTPIHGRGFYSGEHRSLAPRRSDLRRPVPRGLLRLDVGRRALRGHRRVPVHDEPALHRRPRARELTTR